MRLLPVGQMGGPVRQGLFNISDYGAIAGGTFDNTVPINRAIAVLNANGGGTLKIPAGKFLVSGALTPISVPFLIIGEGSDVGTGGTAVSEIICPSDTVVLFTITAEVGRFEKIALRNTFGAVTGGAAIQVKGGTLVQRVDYEGISVIGFYDGIDVQVGARWTMHSSYIYNCLQYGIRIRNTVNPDSGDWSISDSYLAAASNVSTLIRIESSGGGKITNTKFNATTSGQCAFDIDVVGASGTSILLVSNSSFENSQKGIRVVGAWPYITIDGCQFRTQLAAIDLSSTSYVTVANNTFVGSGSNTAIVMTTVDHLYVGPQKVTAYTATLSLTTCTNVTNHSEPNSGVTSRLTGSQAITTASQAIVWPAPLYDPYGYWTAGSPTKYTVPAGLGGRLFLASLIVEDSSPAPNAAIYINGTDRVSSQSGAGFVTSQSVTILLADGDFVEAFIIGGSGSSVIVTDVIPSFSLVPVG